MSLGPIGGKFLADYRKSLVVLGVDLVVTLRRTTTTFPIKGYLGRRSARNRTDDISEGMDQGMMTARFLCEDWRAHAPRDPEIGDQIAINNRRYAIIENPQVRSVNNTDIIFLCDVKG